MSVYDGVGIINNKVIMLFPYPSRECLTQNLKYLIPDIYHKKYFSSLYNISYNE